MTKIILIRHGVTDWNAEGKIQGQSDTQLSSEGMYQARMLIAYFPFETIDAIYSSNLQRAMKTAEFIANKFKLEVIPVRELREIDFGNWEGRSFEDVAKEEPAEFKKFFVQPDMLMFKGGESFAEVQSRAMLSLKKIVKLNGDKKQIVIVTHGAVIRTIIAAILEMPLRKIWSIKQYNTAVNVLNFDDGDYSIELMNSINHLQN